jgi:hypothetical protein
MELTKPGAFAREYEACLAKRSDLPGTLRMFVSSLGSQALRNFAGELAKEKEEGKEGETPGICGVGGAVKVPEQAFPMVDNVHG